MGNWLWIIKHESLSIADYRQLGFKLTAGQIFVRCFWFLDDSGESLVLFSTPVVRGSGLFNPTTMGQAL